MPRGDIRRSAVIKETRSSRPLSPVDTLDYRLPQPKLAVVRQADIEVASTDEWNTFLNKMGASNRSLGKVYVLGSTGCALVQAREIHAMFQDRFPKAGGSRRKTLEIYRRLAKHINSYVNQSEQIRVRSENEKIQTIVNLRIDELEKPHLKDLEDTDLEDPYSIELDMDELIYSRDMITARDMEAACRDGSNKWRAGAFIVRRARMDKFTAAKVGFNLSEHQELWDERNDLRGFLKAEGYPVRLMDSEWVPHLIIFEGFANLGAEDLKVPTVPLDITLSQPKATDIPYEI